MTRLEHFLAYAESHRGTVTAAAVSLILLIAGIDWALPKITVGYLYLVPILLSAAALNRAQILTMAALCAYLREVFDPLQDAPLVTGTRLWHAFNPRYWVEGSGGRLVVVAVGFAMTGFFVEELNRRRRLLEEHLKEREEQNRLRREAEQQTRILIETSPLAILTLDESGSVALANASAKQLLGFEDEGTLQGRLVEPFLPLLPRMLNSHRASPSHDIRTSVECKGQRCNGEVFLAHVWLSTYRTSRGPGLAAVVWDASENLRDREGAGLDSMMATSRVLIGAMSHEIRNLASAASSAYAALAPGEGGETHEQYQALGSLIQGLEKISTWGLRMASAREAVTADLGTVLDETRIVVEPGLLESGISVVWEVAEGLPLVQADHHGLLQVFVNLTRNSQRAMLDWPRRELRVSATLERDLVVVRFADSGPGIANPDGLFKPFHSGGQSTGLGLYISRAILRSHGGGLRYEPTEKGCCFMVELWPVENQN
ncbi:MAG TPA: ATP-binding protein [Bryobacteraceae bacterium]|nr:ATP-binding protein [Bryobacteraceae bacterium]